jgi:tetratricopeptide (TPR) repeat protein
MKSLKTTLQLLCFLLLLFTTSCKSKTTKSVPSLTSIDLLRGDLVLCSGTQFGEVSFSFYCQYETRDMFDLGLSLLHSFEYEEAEKAFVKVIDADPNCSMAYWGVAMSNFRSLWMQSGTDYLKKGTTLLQIADALPKSEREQEYLDAIGEFYKDWEFVDEKTRILNFEKKMELIYNEHEDDKEAAIFYALALRASADPADKTYSNQLKSGKILESIFPDKPNHPGIAHYIIHNYDYPELAKLALETARRYADIAPASAHAQHMPSHIFTRLGLWDESIDTNINSTSSAVCYSESVDPDAHWAQELHAMDYLVYAYLQRGNNKMAIAQNEYMHTFKKVFPLDFAASYAMLAIPARIVLENKHWEKAANLQLPPIDFPWHQFPWQMSILHFTKAMGYSHLGDIVSSEKEVSILQSFHKELININDVYAAKQVLIQIKTSQAWIHYATNNYEEAVALMIEAAKLEDNTAKHPVTPGEVLPTRELLGDLYLALSKPEKALESYETDINKHPNRFNGLYGAAIAAKQAGNKEKATLYFNQLIELTKDSNSDRIEIVEAKEFIGQKSI